MERTRNRYRYVDHTPWFKVQVLNDLRLTPSFELKLSPMKAMKARGAHTSPSVRVRAMKAMKAEADDGVVATKAIVAVKVEAPPSRSDKRRASCAEMRVHKRPKVSTAERSHMSAQAVAPC